MAEIDPHRQVTILEVFDALGLTRRDAPEPPINGLNAMCQCGHPWVSHYVYQDTQWYETPIAGHVTYDGLDAYLCDCSAFYEVVCHSPMMT